MFKKASMPVWRRGQNFGLVLGLDLDKLASASSIWSRPGLGLINFEKNVLSNAKYSLYQCRGCIIASFCLQLISLLTYTNRLCSQTVGKALQRCGLV